MVCDPELVLPLRSLSGSLEKVILVTLVVPIREWMRSCNRGTKMWPNGTYTKAVRKMGK
jgi:hypothetical protein